MRSHNQKGFTLIELLIGLSIVVLLATITVFELRSAKRGDELRTASRLVASDIRAMQSRALAAKNLKTCDTGTELAVCEFSQANCGGNPCSDDIPAAYGVHFVAGTSTYSMFADINPAAAADYHYTDIYEVYESRSILPLGSKEVILDQIISGTSTVVLVADVAFMRQSGSVRIYDSTVPPEPVLLRVRLRHLISNQTIEIEVNRITGRVSIL
jgi:prepilin-type N-terminal cleavage/methylation domain-containing protein